MSPGRAATLTSLPRIVFVTGTDTGVGKTVVTAALSAVIRARGRNAAIYKPVQAGLEDGVGDVDVVRALAGINDVHEGIRLQHPMAPVAAADREGLSLPAADTHVTAIQRLASDHDHTLVEGSGGVLVQLDPTGLTLADIAAAAAAGCGGAAGSAGAIIVCRAALGTLNHTELTVEALTRRRVPVNGVIIGSWPREPSEIELANYLFLSRYSVPLLGAVPEQVGQLTAVEFQAAAAGWFSKLTFPIGAAPGQRGG